MKPAVVANLASNPKGNPLEIARVAGITAAKKTAELISLCHALPLFRMLMWKYHRRRTAPRIITTASTMAQTGVEMEALTAAAVAAITVYDMTRALDKSIGIQDVYLLSKTGGKSGDYQR